MKQSTSFWFWDHLRDRDRERERAMNRKAQEMKIEKGGKVFVHAWAGFCASTTFGTRAGVVLGLLILHPHKNTLEVSKSIEASPVSSCRSALFSSPDSFCIEAWEGLQSSDYCRDPGREQPLLGQMGLKGTSAVGWPVESPHFSNNIEGTIVLCARCGQSSLSNKTVPWSKVWERKEKTSIPATLRCVKRLVHPKGWFCPHLQGILFYPRSW